MSDPRLRWQCRRGMRELDELLVRYLEQAFDSAPNEQKQAFEQLLALSDPELVGLLLGNARPEASLAPVVQHILELPAH